MIFSEYEKYTQWKNEDEIIEQIRKTIIEIFKEECPCKKERRGKKL